MNTNILLRKLSPFANKKIMIANDQDVPDIMNAMMQAHKIYASEYDKICDDFYSGNAYKTAIKIFDFLKSNVKYQIESIENQRIISPSGIISLKNNDCKNFSLFIVGILDACKRKGYFNNKSFYRFASYKILDEIPHHVFAVLIDDDGSEIFIDPVLGEFNDRKIYFHKIDKMPLYSISGVNDAEQKPKKKIVLKIALAPARGAFLLLVGLNFMDKAKKLKQAIEKNADKVQAFWLNLGGNPNELLKKIEQGAKKKRLMGYDMEMLEGEGIGVVATSTATASLTAAPILIKTATFLKTLGIDAGDIEKTGKSLLAKTVSSKVKKVLEKEQQTKQLKEKTIDKKINELETGANLPITKKPEIEETKKSNYFPLIIGGVIFYFILSKN